ncbi:hypothetical protein Lal_00018064 [Lupinus albus]|nr:hypothetical protein Lal_00018064 [Lupinus albus]
MRQEREELRLHLELNDVHTNNTKEMLAVIATKLRISKSATSVGEGSENEGEVESHKTHQNHGTMVALEIGELRVILLVEKEDDENKVDVGEGLESFDSLQLSMYSMTGITSTKSWKVGGTLRDNLGVILIDCRASRKFISREWVDSLQLKVEETHSYVLEVGDGHNVRCNGKCAQLKLSMQQLEVIQDFYVFVLKRMDIVLGLKWLESLREVKVDFGKMELTL